MLIADIIATIESFAPSAFQEDWDNTGVQVGTCNNECTGVLLCVDPSPAVVAEAVEKGCNLIISHHPLLFKGLKRITGANPVQETVIAAIKANVTIYSCHTAVDNTIDGVSYTMARMLGVTVTGVLAPMEPRFCKLSVMVPEAHADQVRNAMFAAGAGTIGNYDCCSYNVSGIGTFLPKDGANPFVGTVNELHREPEMRIDVLVPVWLKNKVAGAMIAAHPYEEPAYEFVDITNRSSKIGSGVIGTLSDAISPLELVSKVKEAFNSPIARCTAVVNNSQRRIRRVAMCGGAGGSFIQDAIAAGADAYITSDTRYHDFVDYKDRILIVDIGHFESEHCTKDIFYQIITQKFTNFAVYKSMLEINPINYI